MEKINLAQKFALISEFWTPKIVGLVGETAVKLVKLSPGGFVWHAHEHEDELFLVIAGELAVKFRDGEVRLGPGELIIVPQGVEHMPVAETEVHVLLVEPLETVNTGDEDESDYTVLDPEWI